MKTIVSLFAALALSLGLMSFAGPANAAYPKSVEVVATTNAPKTVPAGTRPPITFTAKPTAGNAKPTGKVIFVFKKNGKVVRKTSRKYTGGTAHYSFKKFRKGTFTVKAKLKTPSGSIFQGAGDGDTFTVA